jgi:hypothetical protein
MFLSREELADLTGKTRRDAQLRVLRSMGLAFRLRPDGSPIVLRAYVEAMLGGSAAKITPQEPQLQP